MPRNKAAGARVDRAIHPRHIPPERCHALARVVHFFFVRHSAQDVTLCAAVSLGLYEAWAVQVRNDAVAINKSVLAGRADARRVSVKELGAESAILPHALIHVIRQNFALETRANIFNVPYVVLGKLAIDAARVPHHLPKPPVMVSQRQDVRPVAVEEIKRSREVWRYIVALFFQVNTAPEISEVG